MVKRLFVIFFILSLVSVRSLKAQELLESSESFVYQEETPESSPEVVVESSNLVENSDAVNESEQAQIEKSIEQEIIHENSATISAEIQSTESAAAASPSAEPAVNEFQNVVNQSIVNQEVSLESVTGNNTIDTIEVAEINTGTASAQSTLTTEVNTTLQGSHIYFGTQNITEDKTVDLASLESDCSLAVDEHNFGNQTITNLAQINNEVKLTAESGQNSSESTEGDITTGDAITEAHVTTIANTSLIGNCWLFNSLTVFTPFSQSLILPNEEQFLATSINHDLNLLDSNKTPLAITQNATEKTEVYSETNTGANVSSGNLDTGNIYAENEVITQANTTLYGSSWVLVKITNPEYWKGTFDKEVQPTFQDESALYYWLSPQQHFFHDFQVKSADTDQTNQIKIDNTALVKTSVNLTADTGNNTAEGGNSSIVTGNAYAKSKIFNLLNTTVIGDNWYLVLLNLFEDFTGSVSFAKPDLELTAQTQVKAFSGSTIDILLPIYNRGQSTAQNVVLSYQQPTWSSSALGSSRIWQVGSLAPGAVTRVPFSLQLPADLAVGTYTIDFSVSTDFQELSQKNNSTILTFVIESVPNIQISHAPAPKTILAITTPANTYTAKRITSQSIRPPSPKPQIMGTAVTPKQENNLEVNIPTALTKHFCLKNWDLCTAAGILVTTVPVKAFEKKKVVAIPKQLFKNT